jgi:hypothetical protein
MLIDILGADHTPRELLNDPSLIPSTEEDGHSGHVMSDIEKEMRDLVSVYAIVGQYNIEYPCIHPLNRSHS